MFRSVASRLHCVAKSNLNLNKALAVSIVPSKRCMSHENTETDEQFDARFEAYFNRPDIDGWEVRKGMNDLCGMDVVPEPKIIIAALKACRRVNDYAIAVRFIEAVKNKCGPQVKVIYPYIIREIEPTLKELGIDTPEQLGIDQPELALEKVYEM